MACTTSALREERRENPRPEGPLVALSKGNEEVGGVGWGAGGRYWVFTQRPPTTYLFRLHSMPHGPDGTQGRGAQPPAGSAPARPGVRPGRQGGRSGFIHSRSPPRPAPLSSSPLVGASQPLHCLSDSADHSLPRVTRGLSREVLGTQRSNCSSTICSKGHLFSNEFSWAPC